MIGRTVGNYVIREEAGRGAMGVVYVAEHPRIGKRVAVKVLLPELSQRADLVTRFFNEARAAAATRDQHIVDVIDFGELPDGVSYLVMEWLDGNSLAAALAGGRFTVGRAVHVARGIGRALAAAHALGIVHRDLKPDNVFLVRRDDDADFVKVLDFGIAKLADTPAKAQTRLNAFLGTPEYMAPEQWKSSAVDGRADVYALGVMLFEMLSGRLPFTGESLLELGNAHATREPPDLRALAPEVPEPLAQVVRQALEKDPERRFSTVRAFLNALDAATAQPKPAPPPSLPPRNLIIGSIALAGAAALAFGAYMAWPRPDPPAPPPPIIIQQVNPPSPPPSPPPQRQQQQHMQPRDFVSTWRRAPGGSCNVQLAPAQVAILNHASELRNAADGRVLGTVDHARRYVFRGTIAECRGQVQDHATHMICQNPYGVRCDAFYTVNP